MFNSVSKKIRLLGLTGAAIFAVAAQPAFAADTANLDVSASVSEVCNVTTSPVAFGAIDVTAAGNEDAEGGFSVVCTSGLAWTAAASAGDGTGASTADRKMMSGANVLNYALYTGSDHTGNFVSATGTGTGAAQDSIIYGRIPSGQTSVPAGSYADAVVISLTY